MPALSYLHQLSGADPSIPPTVFPEVSPWASPPLSRPAARVQHQESRAELLSTAGGWRWGLQGARSRGAGEKCRLVFVSLQDWQ